MKQLSLPAARRFCVAAVVLALAAAPALAEHAAAHEAPGADLDSLLALARSQNPEFAALRHEADASAERVYPAGALPDPILRTELQNVTNYGSGDKPSLLPNEVGSTKYTLIQALPFWGKRDLKRAVAAAEAQQADGRAQAAWADLAARLKAAYAQYFQAAQSEALTREIQGLLASLEKITQARYAGGLVPQQDVIRAQVERTGVAGDLLMWETERHHLQSRLNTLLRRPPHAPLAIPLRLSPLPAPARLDYATLEERLRARNPQLFVEGARVAAAEKSRELAYKNRYPDFSVGVAPIQTRNRVNEWELMLELNIPLQQESRRAQEREAQAMLAAAQSRQEATQNQLFAELAENLVALETARRQEELIHRNLLPQADLSYQAALAGYENGKVDLATLLDAQRQIRKARLDQLKAGVDARLRLAEIEKLLGEEL